MERLRALLSENQATARAFLTGTIARLFGKYGLKVVGTKLIGVKLLAAGISAGCAAFAGSAILNLGSSLTQLGEKLNPEAAKIAAAASMPIVAAASASSNNRGRAPLLAMTVLGGAAATLILRQRAAKPKRGAAALSFLEQRKQSMKLREEFRKALQEQQESEDAGTEESPPAEEAPPADHTTRSTSTSASSWRAAGAAVLTAARPRRIKSSRFETKELVFGRPEDAALGVLHFMCVTRNGLPMAEGTKAIQREIAEHGTPEDQECLDYILHAPAGSSDLLFSNSPHPRDCDENGVRKDRRTESGEGMRLQDFVEHPSSKAAHLEEAHVVALRLYTTVAYRSLNEPLRDKERFERSEPHRLPVTVAFVDQAIRQLRANEAPGHRGHEHESLSESRFLYRGLRNVAVPEQFMEQGGSELGLMSTTSSLRVAMLYCASRACVLLRLCTQSFMERGADIAYLSTFPAEDEVLYPPLTYLQPTGEVEKVQPDNNSTLTIVDVTPFFPT